MTTGANMAVANSETAAPAAQGSTAGSLTAPTIAKPVALSSVIPYALVALGLRPLMARVFLLPVQPMIEGPAIPFSWLDRDVSFALTLPAEIKASTFEMFQTQYAALPMAPAVAAYVLAS